MSAESQMRRDAEQEIRDARQELAHAVEIWMEATHKAKFGGAMHRDFRRRIARNARKDVDRGAFRLVEVLRSLDQVAKMEFINAGFVEQVVDPEHLETPS